jgi:hypothetical protein
MAIIILAFIPVFALSGQEGKLFHPLAFTKTFAMIGSTLLAVTIVPVLASMLVRGPFHAEERNWIMRGLLKIYDPVLAWALRRRKTVLLFAALLLASALVLALGLPKPALVVVARLMAPANSQRSVASSNTLAQRRPTFLVFLRCLIGIPIQRWCSDFIPGFRGWPGLCRGWAPSSCRR